MQARRDGGTSSTCTGHLEASHVKTTKNPARSTNFKGNIEGRMLRVANRTELLSGVEEFNEEYARAMYRELHHGASQNTSSSSLRGSVMHVEKAIMCYLYFKAKNIQLPACIERSWLKELRIAHEDKTIRKENVKWYRFGRYRKVGGMSEVVVRAPRKNIFTYVNCGRDDSGLPSVGRVYGILCCESKSYILLRWLTPKFVGSSGSIPATHIVRQQHTRLFLTNVCAVIHIDQLENVVHIVPDFKYHTEDGKYSYFYVNNIPLGTTLRSQAKHDLYALQEHKEQEHKECETQGDVSLMRSQVYGEL